MQNSSGKPNSSRHVVLYLVSWSASLCEIPNELVLVQHHSFQSTAGLNQLTVVWYGFGDLINWKKNQI